MGRRKRERERDSGTDGKTEREKENKTLLPKVTPLVLGIAELLFSEHMPPQNHIVDRHCFVTQIVLVIHSISKQEPF